MRLRTRIVACLLLCVSGARADWTSPGSRVRANFNPKVVRPAPYVDKGGAVYNVKGYGAVCDGVTDDTTALTNALAAASGGTLLIPTKCLLLIHSPCASAEAGACASGPYTSFTVATNTRIKCEDGTAGFTLARRKCTGGRYPGAYCTADDQCQGSGGTCGYETSSPASRYTNTNAATVYNLFVAAANSTNVQMESCAIYTYQADAYQRCSDANGLSAAPACKLYCTGGTIPGWGCEVDGDCTGSGTCTNTADCNAGTCTTAPASASGAGKLNVVDFSASDHATIRNVQVYDHFVGDVGLKVGTNGLVEYSNTARTPGDCISDLGATFGGIALPFACYSPFLKTNATQPTVSVTTGILVGANSRVYGNTARGVTAINDTGGSTVIDSNTIAPPTVYGPGLASGTGIKGVGSDRITKNQVVASTQGITLAGDSMIVTENMVGGVTPDTLDYGIVIDGVANADVSHNQVFRPELIAIWIKGAAGNTGINGNTLNGAANATINSVGIRADGTGFNHRIEANALTGFFRGIDQGQGSSYNFEIVGNVFTVIGASNIGLGNAGVHITGGRINPTGSMVLTCGPGCSNRGTICTADATCTSCTTGPKCGPEALITLGATDQNLVSAHAMVQNVLIYSDRLLKQCTVASIGKACTADGDCTGGGGLCNSTTTLAHVRVLSYGASGGHGDDAISGNTFLGCSSGQSPCTFLDVGMAAGTTTITGLSILNNVFDLLTGTATAIKYPATASLLTFAGVAGNTMKAGTGGVLTETANWNATMGRSVLLTGNVAKPVTISVAGCNDATAATRLDLPTSSAAVPACLGTSPNRFGVLGFVDTSVLTAQFPYFLPSTFIQASSCAGAGNPYTCCTGASAGCAPTLDVIWFSLGTTQAVTWTLTTACVTAGDLLAPSFTATTSVTDTNNGTASTRNVATFNPVTLGTCAAGDTMFIRVGRDGAAGADTYTGTAQMFQLILTVQTTQ